MAQRVIQLLRSSSIYLTKDAAKTTVGAMTGQDGEIRIARYYGPEYTKEGQTVKDVKDLLCVYHSVASGENNQGWTFIEDASDISDILSGLDGNINATAPQTAGADPTATDPDMVVTAVLEVDGKVTGAAANITSITLDGYAEQTAAAVAATDSLGVALGKLQGQINGMDLAAVGGSGKIVTTVSEADGKVSATAIDTADAVLTGYAASTSNTGAIAATDTLEQAFNKVENAIAANDITAGDDSITINTTGGGKALSVNVDGTTIVKDSTTGALKSNLTIIKEDANTSGVTLDTNVKEQYKLVYDGSTTALGQVIKIYKDSALQEVYLGSDQDTINASTGVITKVTVTDPQSMNFAYQLADGTYSLTKIDVSKFLTESEFGDGLQVSGAGVVSVKKDATSGKVRIADTPSGVTPGDAGDTGLVDVLTVSSNGVKVDNIQAAITYAVQNASADIAISAQGDDYITAAVDANNNKKINVTADVQTLTATAGTPGTYGTDGSQTTAPVDGTLSGTADSLADGADIATKVKTYVDGQVAIEAARSDAKNKADIKTAVEALDATVGSTTVASDKHVAVQVVEADGVLTGVTVTESDIASATDLTNEIAARKAVDGQSGDTYTANSGANYISTATSLNNADVLLDTQVKANADEIANGLNSISASNTGVTVGAKSSKTQTVGLNLDTTSDTSTANNQYSSSQGNGGSGSNVLQITANGLYLSEVWDCGTY